MSNSMRGAVAFEVGERQLSLAFTTNAMVRYQDMSGETFLTGIVRLQKDPSDIRRLRWLFSAGLPAKEGITADQAGDMIDALTVKETGELITKAIELALPPAEDAPGNGRGAGKARPKAATN